jgi:hypothetical protein
MTQRRSYTRGRRMHATVLVLSCVTSLKMQLLLVVLKLLQLLPHSHLPRRLHQSMTRGNARALCLLHVLRAFCRHAHVHQALPPDQAA